MNNSDGSYNRKRAYTLKAKIREVHGGIAVNCDQISRVARTIGGYDPNNLQEQLLGTHGDLSFLVFQGRAQENKIGRLYSF